MGRTLLTLALLAASATAQEERRGDTIPFELKTGILFVKATVNGQGPFTFIFDTGASVTVIRPQTAKKLGFDVKDGGMFGAPTVVKLDSLSLGKAEVRDLRVAVMSVPQAELPLAMQGIRFDGLVGYNVISRFVTTIDYKVGTIKLVPNDYVPEETLPLPKTGPKAAVAVYVGLSPRALGADEANEIGIDGGVVVQKIAKDSPAEKGGLREKDIIQEIAGRRILAMEDYDAAVRASKPDDVLVFRVIRDRKDVEVKIKVAARK